MLHARHKDRVIRWSLPRYVWRSTCWSEQVGEHGRDASHAVRDTRASRGWPNRQERRRTRRDGLTSTEERRIRRGASRRVRTPLLPRAPTKPTLWRRHRRFATPLALPRFLPPPPPPPPRLVSSSFCLAASNCRRLFLLLLPRPSSFSTIHPSSFLHNCHQPANFRLLQFANQRVFAIYIFSSFLKSEREREKREEKRESSREFARLYLVR